MELVVLKMSYTDALGNVYPDSAWLPVQINIGFADGDAMIFWSGYKDKSSALNRSLLIPGAVKRYYLSREEFQTYASSQIGDNPPAFVPQIFAHAMNTLDTNGKSFFDGAVTA